MDELSSWANLHFSPLKETKIDGGFFFLEKKIKWNSDVLWMKWGEAWIQMDSISCTAFLKSENSKA